MFGSAVCKLDGTDVVGKLSWAVLRQHVGSPCGSLIHHDTSNAMVPPFHFFS